MQKNWICAPGGGGVGGGAVFGPPVLVSAHPPPKIRRKLPFTETWIPEPPNMLDSLSGGIFYKIHLRKLAPDEELDCKEVEK